VVCQQYFTTNCTAGLDIDQYNYKLAVTVHRCLRNQAPTYLTDYCVPVSDVAGRLHLLRSASRHQLTVQRVRCSTFGCRSFASTGSTVWNSLPNNLSNPAVGPDQFRRNLKTDLFAYCWRFAVCLSVCLSVRGVLRIRALSVAFMPAPDRGRHYRCLSVCLFVCFPVCLSVCLSVRLSVCRVPRHKSRRKGLGSPILVGWKPITQVTSKPI